MIKNQNKTNKQTDKNENTTTTTPTTKGEWDRATFGNNVSIGGSKTLPNTNMEKLHNIRKLLPEVMSDVSLRRPTFFDNTS